MATRTLAVCLFVRAPQLLARGGLPAVLAATLLAGCVSMGPRSVRLERTAYNRAVTETQEEELLLNLVRARYMRGVSFLEIASISSSLSVEAGVGGTVGASTVAGGDFATGALVYADQPTIIYQPVSGELFVRQLLTPLSLNSIALLIAGGFDTADVFQVFASQINGLLNARIDADAGTSAPAAYEDFDRAISLLEALVARNAIITGAIGPDADSLFVRLTPEGKRSPEGCAFIDLLRLDPAAPQYQLELSEATGGRDVIAIGTRSVAAALQDLSKGVQGVPVAHLAEVDASAEKDGLDWARILADLLVVRVSATKPAGAAIRTHYRGNWFYIDETDLESKKTFGLIGTVLRLQAGGAGATNPVLTLPVSAR